MAIPVFLAALVVLGLSAPEPRVGEQTPNSVYAASSIASRAVAPVVAPLHVGVAPLARSVPVSLTLPSLGVVSDLMDLGLNADGSLEVPPAAYPAGWYTGAPTPGELGPAILAGHVDYASQVGVFSELHRMLPGDEIWVLRADGTTAVFVVSSVAQYAKDGFPTAEVYGNLDYAGLRLITCGGEFDTTVNSHRDNVVVFAALDHVVRA